jgi:hypothetical protein
MRPCRLRGGPPRLSAYLEIRSPVVLVSREYEPPRASTTEFTYRKSLMPGAREGSIVRRSPASLKRETLEVRGSWRSLRPVGDSVLRRENP